MQVVRHSSVDLNDELVNLCVLYTGQFIARLSNRYIRTPYHHSLYRGTGADNSRLTISHSVCNRVNDRVTAVERHHMVRLLHSGDLFHLFLLLLLLALVLFLLALVLRQVALQGVALLVSQDALDTLTRVVTLVALYPHRRRQLLSLQMIQTDWLNNSRKRG